MIIDAHAHTFSQVNGLIAAGPTRSIGYGQVQVGDGQIIRLVPPLNPMTTFPPEILLKHMDWAGVDKAVLLQGSFYGEANSYVWQAVKQWPDRFIGAAFIDPRASNARQTFRQVIEEFGFRIIKFEMSETAGFVGLYPDLRIDEEPFLVWLYEQVERLGLVVTLDLGSVGSQSYQTEAIKTILQRHPRLKIVIPHLAQPPISQRSDPKLDQLWQEQIMLGQHPNVWLDLSALPAYASAIEDYPYPTALQYLHRAVGLIGADKIMWGTDAPGLLSHASYPQLLNFVARHCDFLSQDDLKKILGRNAWQVYLQ